MTRRGGELRLPVGAPAPGAGAPRGV